MNKICRHGIDNTKLNCLLCNKNAKNYCKCNNNGTCELCKVFKPLTKQINEVLEKICIQNNLDISILQNNK